MAKNLTSFVALRGLFLRLAAVTAGGAAVAGCGTPGVDRAQFDQNICTSQGFYEKLPGVTPKNPVDFLQLRIEEGTTGQFTTDSEVGLECKTATITTCESNLAALMPNPGWQVKNDIGIGTSLEDMVFTRGNEVGEIGTTDGVVQFIMPIENVKDAALVATLQGHTILCDGGNNARAINGGFDLLTETGDTCSSGLDEHRVHVTADGTLTVLESVHVKDGQTCLGTGRHTEGVTPHGLPLRAASAIGAYFAEAAYLEAVSVFAFERMAAELRAHGAPEDLVRRAEQAKSDEVRHTRATSKLAARFGGAARGAEAAVLPVRGLFDIALENAVEGCVRETLGALIATVQAERATDTGVAAAMRGIARDETEHAALAWDVASWLDGKLTVEERARIQRARERAVADLGKEVMAPRSDALADIAGLPAPAHAKDLVDALARDLWAA